MYGTSRFGEMSSISAPSVPPGPSPGSINHVPNGIISKSPTSLVNQLVRFVKWFVLFCCSCTSKYVGEYCQHLNPCHTGPGPRCQNGGSCQVRVSAGGSPSFTCLCPLGFSASLCEIPIANSCDRRPCLNGGTCSLRSLEAYQCSCAPGYTGNELWSFCKVHKNQSVKYVISNFFWCLWIGIKISIFNMEMN
jgi:hypothetical protein